MLRNKEILPTKMHQAYCQKVTRGQMHFSEKKGVIHFEEDNPFIQEIRGNRYKRL